ncbi:protein ZAR1-like [Pseudophryne corroboree]|uniref:protein ZAR1-like n=1 Tax=Pseudophryne corroboree TaxID=495146 RepID=UPI0030814F16
MSAMAGFMFAPYNAYSSHGGRYGPPAPQLPARNKQVPSWRAGKIPEPMDYLDSVQRAQLKALLSQVNPNLTPRHRKANTKEVGVQVNPRVDAGVQCSLGPRTLRKPAHPADTSKAAAEEPVRFTRPVAVYSPVVAGRVFSLPQGGRPARKSTPGPGYKPSPESKPGQEPAPETRAPESEVESPEASTEQGLSQEEQQKSAFQFLEQKYGYFHCKECKTRWESAYVWCISGSNKVYFKQLCRKCQKGFNPYRVEGIQCHVCTKTRCSCPQKKRHIDLKRPHRQELCGRCKNKKLSCDNTYSFKYIV